MTCFEMGVKLPTRVDMYGNTCPVCKTKIQIGMDLISHVPTEFKRFIPLNRLGREVRWIHTNCMRSVIQAHYNEVYPGNNQPQPAQPEPTPAYEQNQSDVDLLLEQMQPANQTPVQSSEEVDELRRRLNLAEIKLRQNTSELSILQGKVKEIEESRPQITQIVLPSQMKIEINGTVRKEVPTILKMINAGLNVMMVGPTGSGKTYLGGQLAKMLNKPFSCLSCFENMEPADILGEKGIKNGDTEFELSHFIQTLQDGGVGLLDEFDAGNANTNLCLNSLLANRFVYLDNRRIEIPQEAVIMFSANTFGRGPSREYCGRNQMDAATRDRFKLSTVWIDYDEKLEEQLCPDDDLLLMLHVIRERINDYKIRQVVSTRTVENAYKLLQAGFDHAFIKKQLLQDWTPDEINKL